MEELFAVKIEYDQAKDILERIMRDYSYSNEQLSVLFSRIVNNYEGWQNPNLRYALMETFIRALEKRENVSVEMAIHCYREIPGAVQGNAQYWWSEGGFIIRKYKLLILSEQLALLSNEVTAFKAYIETVKEFRFDGQARSRQIYTLFFCLNTTDKSHARVLSRTVGICVNSYLNDRDDYQREPDWLLILSWFKAYLAAIQLIIRDPASMSAPSTEEGGAR